MITNDPQNQLGSLKRFQRIATVTCVAFFVAVFATGIIESLPRLELAPLPLWGWYLAWIIFQTVTLIPLVLLLAGTELRKLHITVRLKTIFGYLTRAWLVYFAFRLRFAFSEGIAWPGVVIRLSIISIVLGVIYWLLCRRYADKPETMFP